MLDKLPDPLNILRKRKCRLHMEVCCSSALHKEVVVLLTIVDQLCKPTSAVSRSCITFHPYFTQHLGKLSICLLLVWRSPIAKRQMGTLPNP